MAVISLAAAAGAQTSTVQLPKPDSAGWIKLWRGDNQSDFFTYYSPSNNNNAFPDNTFKFNKDTITVTGSPTGHLIFKQAFSHYRVRYEQMMPTRLGNCGMLVHIQLSDPALFNQFPRSIECHPGPGPDLVHQQRLGFGAREDRQRIPALRSDGAPDHLRGQER
jgi:hypothetical protein